MARTGIAHLPLHGGKAPRWLFERMSRLAREILLAIRADYSSEEILARLSDPFWFQAFGCVLGFDWHSSGLTTTVCGALQEASREVGSEIGFYVAGGKGRRALQTPLQIETLCAPGRADPAPLQHASRMAAKVDSALVQDGFELYHHCLFFSDSGNWAVIQQGMNDATGYARRYHWLSERVHNFTCEPHAAIESAVRASTLNLVAEESQANNAAVLCLVRDTPREILSGRIPVLEMPREHQVPLRRYAKLSLEKILRCLKEESPQSYEQVVQTRGIGAAALRALALTAEVIHGASPSRQDPARYSFAHGGKDGTPFPVQREVYDFTIQFLKEKVNATKLEPSEKRSAFRRLANFLP